MASSTDGFSAMPILDYFTNTLGVDVPFGYVIQYEPFRITQQVTKTGVVYQSAIFNSDDTLFFDSGATEEDQAVSVGIFFENVRNVFGIPSRASSFVLSTTETSGPYRMWNQDQYYKPWESTWPLYGAVPYVMGLQQDQSTGFAWMNSAETFVTVLEKLNTNTFVSFVS